MLPQLREIEQRFPDVVVIGVHSGKYIAERETARIAAAAERLGVAHPVVNDRQFRVWRAFAVRAWPTLVAIDARGAVIGMHAGEFTADGLEPFLRRTLAAVPSPATPLPFALAHATDSPGASPSATTLRHPGKIAVDGVRIAIADTGHHRVLVGRLDLAGGRMHVERAVGSGRGFADGDAPRFDGPQGLLFDGDRLLVADAGNHAVREIRLADGVVRTIAGTGRQLRSMADLAAGALSSPWDLVRHGDRIVVAMAGVHRLWTIDARTGAGRPFSGSGAEELHDAGHAQAAFAQPMGITASPDALFVADAESSAVRRVDASDDGAVRTIVGTGLFDFGDRDGAGDVARLQHPQGIAYDGERDRVLVADSYNDSLRWLDPLTRECTTWVRGLHEPAGVALTASHAVVADTGAHRIVTVDRARSTTSVLALVDAT